MSETREERERRISKATDDIVAKFTPSVETMVKDMRRSILGQKLPVDGKPIIGDLTRSEAIAYSSQFVQLAFMLNQVIPELPDTAPTEKPRKKRRPVIGLSI